MTKLFDDGGLTRVWKIRTTSMDNKSV